MKRDEKIVFLKMGLVVVVAVVSLLGALIAGIIAWSCKSSRSDAPVAADLPIDRFAASRTAREAVLQKRIAQTIEEKRAAYLASQAGKAKPQ